MKRDDPEFRRRINSLARPIPTEEADNATMRNAAPLDTLIGGKEEP